MDLIVSSVTSKGSSHATNEDNFIVGENYYIIADGMGGENAGEIASKIVIESISNYISDVVQNGDENAILAKSSEAISHANKNIDDYMMDNPDSIGMGTTVLIAIKKEDILYITWCGDSHAFVYNNKHGLRSLTKDHSYVQDLIDAGEISEEESYSHPDNNLITRFVGGGYDSCIPESVTYNLRKGDIIILCSDGLSGYCTKNIIQKELENKGGNLADNLRKLALQYGSEDDITVITLSPPESSKKKSSLFGWFSHDS